MKRVTCWVVLCAGLSACGGSSSSNTPAAGHDGGGSALGRAGAEQPAAGGGGHEAGAGGSAPAANGGGHAQGSGGAGPAAGGGGDAAGADGSGPAADSGDDAPAMFGDCPAFPADDAWNRVVEHDAVSASWTAHVQALVGASRKLHPDYGNSGSEHYGIPINHVPSSQAKVDVTFDEPDESDPGPYPFPGPDQVKIEGGTATDCDGDCHVLVVQDGECKLYEGDACGYANGAWHCYSGAIWDLKQNSQGQRTQGFTSADAAGLAIAPGLVRYDEAQAGEIHHALRFTLHCTSAGFVAPASHFAVPGGCKDNADAPPMGLRVRLKASYDISSLTGSAHAVARAMQRYGMILADNGSDFYFQGEADTRFNEADTEPLKNIPASAFEALEPGPVMKTE
jgi:hypothetical protein